VTLAARVDAILGTPTAALDRFTFAAWCHLHPGAGLVVLHRESHGAVQRTHVACRDCGLGWTITATITPTKDHVAEELGIPGRHNTHLAYRGNHRPARAVA
jgi:hypothetical protein